MKRKTDYMSLFGAIKTDPNDTRSSEEIVRDLRDGNTEHETVMRLAVTMCEFCAAGNTPERDEYSRAWRHSIPDNYYPCASNRVRRCDAEQIHEAYRLLREQEQAE